MRLIDRGIPGRQDVPTMPRVVDALREIIDPELGIDIVSLGLVREVEIDGQSVWVRMTLTSQACPVGPQLVEGAKRNIEMRVPGVQHCEIQLLSEPPWSPEMMEPNAKSMMGW